jgi:O-antigen/teichoic acid export membrane protein
LLSGVRARHVIVASVVGEAVVAAACLIDLARRGSIGFPRLRWDILKEASAYGVPLAAAGSATLILDYGDRFLIERFLDVSAVATYAVPYDLAQSLAAGLFAPVRLAVVPVIFRLWANDGPEVTSAFVSDLFTYLVAFSIPIAALFLVLSEDLIVLLASAKYRDAAHLIPYLLPGVFLAELNFLIATAMTVEKRTLGLAVLVLVAGIGNIVLNLIAIPLWGLVGAALCTTVAYAGLVVATYVRTLPVLGLRLRAGLIAKSVLATAIMAGLVSALGPLSSARFLDLAARGSVGVVVAAGCLWALDRDLRQRAWAQVARP